MICILLVEDNEMNREILSRRLVRRGFEVHEAVDGLTAVNLAREILPDIILMDLNLPVIDGWEATRRIKGAADTASIPILCITAHAMAGDRELGIAAGCDEYDTKPMDFDRILDKIAELTGSK